MITQPTVINTTTSMTTARRPMSSIFLHSNAVDTTHTAAAIKLCSSGVIVVQTNCR